MASLPRLPERRNTIVTSKAAATKVNRPTNACSRFDSICFLVNSGPGLFYSRPTQPPRKVRRSISCDCRLPASMPLRRIFPRQHLQVVYFPRKFRLGNAVQELANARTGARAQLFGRAVGHDVTLIHQDHPVGDQE